MRLSSESSRSRWRILGATWVAAAALLILHAVVVHDYLDVANKAGLRGAAHPATPLQQCCLSFESDAQTWIEHAIALTEGHDVQLRYTTIDNAPDGREVHWNSGWAWAIAGAGHVRRWFTGEPLPTAIERAAFWLNAVVLFGLIVLFSSLTARRAGAAAGVLLVLGMVGHSQFYEGFFPGYADHHGLLTAAVMGLVLGVLAMGAGWWRAPEIDPAAALPASARTVRIGAIFSAVCGAFGMWVSAASLIPPIAIVGLVALAVVMWRGRRFQANGATFDPGAWRWWGRIGAGLSLCFYLLEYAPRHVGMRLEANHPFYALAWLGGGELVAQLAERWLAAPEKRWARPRQLVLPLLAVLIVPLTIVIGGTSVFILRDPFQAQLPHFVLEGLNLFERIQRSGWTEVLLFLQLSNLPLALALLLLWLRRSRDNVLLWLTFLVTFLLTAMGWWQTRWLLNASGAQICLALVVLATTPAGWRPAVRWLATLGFAGLLYLPPIITQISGTRTFARSHTLSPTDALQPLFRDVAAALRASQPAGDIVLLSSPNSSAAIGYYGRFRTIGTLYWENLAGLKTAAAIFSATTDREAAVLIRAHGITHLAMISEENFLEQYFQLLHPTAKPEDARKTFGYRLLVERKIPTWLQIIPYQLPPDLQSLKVSIMLFKVTFGQTDAEALYHVAEAKIVLGDKAGAEKDFETVTRLAPTAPEPWLRRGELLIDRKAWDLAVDSFLNGIKRAPRTEWPRLCNTAASAFYTHGAIGAALRMFQESLALGFDPAIASNVAWLRATAADASLRNGDEAVALAQRAVQANPGSPVFLNALAAALAEKGRFPEAVDAATRALDATRSGGSDAATVTKFEQHLAAYRASRPWRE